MTYRTIEIGGRLYERRDTPLLSVKAGNTIPGYGPDYGPYHPTRWTVLADARAIPPLPTTRGVRVGIEVYDIYLDSIYTMIDDHVHVGAAPTFTVTTREVYR